MISPPPTPAPTTVLSPAWPVLRPRERRAPPGVPDAGHLQHPSGRRRLGAALRRRRSSAGPSMPTSWSCRSHGHPMTGARARPPRSPAGWAIPWWPRSAWPTAVSSVPIRPPPSRWGPPIGPWRTSFRLDEEHWRRSSDPAGTGYVDGTWGVAMLSRVPVHRVRGHPAEEASPGRGPAGRHRLHRRPGRRAARRLRDPHVPHHPWIARPVPPAARPCFPRRPAPPCWPGT